MKEPCNGVERLSRVMEILCPILQVLGAVCILSLPWTLPIYLRYKYAWYSGRLCYSMLVLLAVSGVCAFFILGQGRRILHGIALRDPFTLDTARRIRIIAYLCMPISAVYLISMFFIPSALVLLVGLAFLFLSVVVLIMASLFYEAVRFKQENDLTI